MLLTLIVTIIFCYVSSTSRDHERIGLDRRRLEIAHLQYAALVVQDWYPESFSLLHSFLGSWTSQLKIFQEMVFTFFCKIFR